MDLPSFLPGWDTVRKIGKGGFSTVYEIKKIDETGDFRAALKVISIPSDESEYATFNEEGYDDEVVTTILKSRIDEMTKEFSLMNRLKGSNNIVGYEDHVVMPKSDGIGWNIYIRMELLTPMNEYIKKNGVSVGFVIDLGISICKALERCEAINIIHRDIKPQNIFLNDFGDIKLGDFGIAKTSDHTTKATKSGTFSYMSPEVYNNQPYNNTVDIYSLGLLLFWLLNERRHPFLVLPPDVPKASEMDMAQVRRMSGEKIPKPKNGNDKLKRIVLKACAFESKERYQSAAEMRQELEEVKKHMQNSGEDAAYSVCIISSSVEHQEMGQESSAGETYTDTGISESSENSDGQFDGTVCLFEEKKHRTSDNSSKTVIITPATTDKSPNESDDDKTMIENPGEINNPAEPNDNRNNKRFPIICISAASLLAIIAIVLGVMSLNNRESVGDDSSPTDIVNIAEHVETPDSAEEKEEIQDSEDITALPTDEVNIENENETSDDSIIEDDSDDSDDTNDTTIEPDEDDSNDTTIEPDEDDSNDTTIEPDEDDSNDTTIEPDEDDSAATPATTPQGHSDQTTDNKTEKKSSDTKGSDKKSAEGNNPEKKPKEEKWSDWVEKLPDKVTKGKYEIEESKQYRTGIIMKSAQSAIDGWELYGVTEDGSFGKWSEWTTNPVSEMDKRQIEVRTRYSYRDKEDKISSESKINGWILNPNGSTYGGFGAWSEWKVNEKITSSSTREVETKNQYRYRTIKWKEKSSWSAWGDMYYSSTDEMEVQSRTVTRYRDRVILNYFYRWGDWSPWSDEEYQPSASREVRSQTEYRYKDDILRKTNLFIQWSKWKNVKGSLPAESDELKLQQRKLYRYRKK